MEHIEGTEASCDYFEFKAKKSSTGNVISTLEGYMESLPNAKVFDQSLVPVFLKDLSTYNTLLAAEIDIYKKIAKLAKSLSDNREDSKIKVIIKLFEKHPLILAYDSTPLTLNYLKHRMDASKEDLKSLVISGNTESNKELAKDYFKLGSETSKVVGLCSDAMSEGVNLQQASAIVLLDMPSV
ncbi:MAG: hypothetical protein RIF34_05610, partial [Candidatus Kapaibacterium sp.]